MSSVGTQVQVVVYLLCLMYPTAEEDIMATLFHRAALFSVFTFVGQSDDGIVWCDRHCAFQPFIYYF